ncbi:PREDICTED: potassium-transporting ATPase subunit beta [Nanorana parkeri]|uniref:potassium-transporting ATPase subunit beta n=1 Tax=Nanorana parkeri TaxID=125878 RepID=UPI000854BD46|nr:PREDICTED: potassium-transporting ATPase subunit beta [Nanorana parkeri]
MATFNEKKTCSQRMENFGRFMWNPDTGEFMGRSPIKWVYIILYYVAFYIVMIGIFALSIYSLMHTISPYEPDYKDIITSPGVTMRPDVYGDEKIELYYNTSDKATYENSVKTLIKFLEQYNTTTQQKMNKNCTGITDVASFLSGPGRTKYACQFVESELGDCAYNLSDEDPFGFQKGQPCIFIRINRIIHFVPRNHSIPTLECLPKTKEVPWEVKYYPEDASFNLQYFPYYGKKAQPNYTNPVVAVKLVNVPHNKLIEVVCTVHADGITTDNIHDPYEGKVTFKLNIKG